MNDVLAIVTQYNRPVGNVPAIAEALRQQTVPVDIVIVDNTPRPVDLERFVGPVFDYWRFTENAGPPCRFAPAFMDHLHEYTFFIDDDLVPGNRCIENLLRNYELVGGKYATIGEIGRIHDSGKYAKRNIRRHGQLRRVDMTARGHFIRTGNMRHVLNAKWSLIEKFGSEAFDLVAVHDDLLLCCGIQMATGWPSYLTASNSDKATLIRHRDLPDNGGGVSAKLDFVADRNRLIQMFQAIGWESLT
jgi:hypothetical protein